MLKYGFLEEGRYFTFWGVPPLLGFSDNFTYISCTNCPKEMFRDGSTGAGLVSATEIPIEHLELWIPIISD